MNIDHLLVNLFGAHFSSEHGGGGEVAAMAWVSRTHHVFSIPHLLSKFGNCQCPVLLGPTRGQRGESNHEEVEPGKWDKVDS